MHCRKMCLHIDTGAAFVRGSDQDPLCAGAHFTKKGILCSIGLRIMDKCDLICRDTLFYKFCFQIIIDIKAVRLCPRNREHFFFPSRSRCPDIRKDKLCAGDPFLLCLAVFIQHIFHYLIQLPLRIVRSVR